MHTNNKGLTLMELLAAITISGIVLVTVMLFTQYSGSTATKLSTREDIMKESRLTINHIVQAVRDNLIEASIEPTHVLLLDEIEYILGSNNVKVKKYTGNYTYYTFDEATNSVTYKKFFDGQLIQQTLSTHVNDLNITLSQSNKKIEIELIMQLPNNQTNTASTVIYVPQL